MGCRFDITERCPALRERVGVPLTTEIERNVTRFINETRLIPVAVGVPLLVGAEEIRDNIIEEGASDQLSGGISSINQGENQILDKMYKGFLDGANYRNCLNYTDAITRTCKRVDIFDENDTTTYDITACCGVLYSMWMRGCLCPPLGDTLLSNNYDSLLKIAPEACGFSIKDIPNDVNCVTDLSETFEDYVSDENLTNFD